MIIIIIVIIIIKTFLKNLTFQFPSSSFSKVVFEYVEICCYFKLFGNFIPQRRTNERKGIQTYGNFMEYLLNVFTKTLFK